jgi:predicted nucleic acid-binding protein
MILADTSIWIDHLRTGDARLSTSLHASRIITHPFVIGELALGRLKQRGKILTALADLPQAPVATASEVLHFIEQNGLAGQSIGYVDAHLLAAVRLGDGTTLWTRDKRLRAIAERLGLAPSC